MVDRELKGEASKWPNPAWVSMDYRLGIKLSTIGIRSTYNNDQVIFTILLDNSFNILLAIQVKCTCCCSYKALSLDQ